MLRKTAGSRFRRKCEEVWTAGWQQLLDRDRSTSSRGRHTCMHVGSRALPRRPIRVHAALAGRGRLAVGGGGGSGRRQSVGLGARCCRSASPCLQTHGLQTRRVPACPCVGSATHTETELGAGDDSRDTAGRLRTARGFIRVCAKNHSRGMHAARGITVIVRSKSKTWTEHGTLHRRDRVAS